MEWIVANWELVAFCSVGALYVLGLGLIGVNESPTARPISDAEYQATLDRLGKRWLDERDV